MVFACCIASQLALTYTLQLQRSTSPLDCLWCQIANKAIVMDGLDVSKQQSVHDQLLDQSLNLVTSCLNFDFIGTNPDESIEEVGLAHTLCSVHAEHFLLEYLRSSLLLVGACASCVCFGYCEQSTRLNCPDGSTTMSIRACTVLSTADRHASNPSHVARPHPKPVDAPAIL